MNSDRPVSELAKLIPELLEGDNTVSFEPRGGSMLPTIAAGDSVTLKRADTYKKDDIVLYLRKDGKAVLHRIVDVCDDGTFVMRGDAQIPNEYGIQNQQIIAKVVSFTHNGKKIEADSPAFLLMSYKSRLSRFLKRAKNKIKRSF